MIEHLVSAVIDAAGQHWLMAYTVVGLMAAAEALPVVGTVVPGSALIVGISALVPSGALSVWLLIGAAILGAVAGDGLSFWLGHHFQRDLLGMWPFRRYPSFVERAEQLFRRHGGKSVFLARFIQGPRAFIPLVVGMSGMRPLRFYAFNLASALVWAPSHVLLGVAIGASLTLVAAVAGRLALFLAIVILVLWVAGWLVRKLVLVALLPSVDTLQVRLASWTMAKDTWLRRQLRGLVRAEQREARALLMGATVLIGSLWLFFGILEDVLSGDPLVQANVAVFHFLQSLRTAWGDRVMIAVTEMGDTMVTSTVAGATLAWLLWKRSWRAAAYLAAAIGGAVAFTMAVKLAVHWPRPTEIYRGWDAFSFPSGHATVNAVLYGFLCFLVARELRLRWRASIVAAAGVLVALIAMSRLYLGAHWVSDVTAGIAFGAAWVSLLAMSYIRHQPRRLGGGVLLTVVGLSFIGAWSFHMDRAFMRDVSRYAPQQSVRKISLAEWRDHAYRSLPARRVDLGGETEEPIVLQWVGDVSALKDKLSTSGWHVSAQWSLNDAARWITAASPPLTLPVLPRLHDGRSPTLTMVHRLPRDEGYPGRIVLLVWSSNVLVDTNASEGFSPLWLGAVFKQKMYHPLNLVTIGKVQSSVNAARDLLAEGLSSSRLVTRLGMSRPGWDGHLLLAVGPTER